MVGVSKIGTSNLITNMDHFLFENIIVSGSPGARKLEGNIDWEQAGWYHEYWEYCKMLYGVKYEHERQTDGWGDKVMKPYKDKWWVFSEYFLWRGCP